jgi:hypothetical protein
MGDLKELIWAGQERKSARNSGNLHTTWQARLALSTPRSDQRLNGGEVICAYRAAGSPSRIERSAQDAGADRTWQLSQGSAIQIFEIDSRDNRLRHLI